MTTINPTGGATPPQGQGWSIFNPLKNFVDLIISKIMPQYIAQSASDAKLQEMAKEVEAQKGRDITVADVGNDIFENWVTFFGGDATSVARNACRLTPSIGPESQTVATLASPVIGLSILAGAITMKNEINSALAASKIGDTEGVVYGTNGALSGFFNGVAGLFWGITEWSSAVAVSPAGEMLATLVSPLFAASSLFALINKSKNLYDVCEFENEFLASVPENVSEDEQREKGIEFFEKQLTLSKEEIGAIIKEVNASGVTGKNRVEEIRKKCQDAVATKRARFERRTNGECVDLILENLTNWKNGYKGDVAVTDVIQKVKDTIFWNKVRLVFTILILILGLAASIAFALTPAGSVAIFATFLATGIIWMILDARGSMAWIPLRKKVFGDATDPKPQVTA